MFREGVIRRTLFFKDYNRLLQNYYYGIGWIHDEGFCVYHRSYRTMRLGIKRMSKSVPISKSIMPMKLWRILSRKYRQGRPLYMD